MRLFQKLKVVAELLRPYDGYYAVCGGIAACLYRETPRYTGDIDIALVNPPGRSAKEVACGIIEQLGYAPKFGFITNQNGMLINEVALVAGREDKHDGFVGIDLMLPVLEWIEEAVTRAQLNKLDYGFGLMATVLPEDLIVAKLFAYQGTPGRKNDLDDILSIIANMKDLNRELLSKLIDQHKLTVPQEVATKLDQV